VRIPFAGSAASFFSSAPTRARSAASVGSFKIRNAAPRRCRSTRSRAHRRVRSLGAPNGLGAAIADRRPRVVDVLRGSLGRRDDRQGRRVARYARRARPDMQTISTRQRLLLRAIVLVALLLLLAMFGFLGRNPPIVH
jgi:hypothetical protein